KEGIDIPLFRGTNYPDEPALAIALAKNNIEPVNDRGRFSRTLIGASRIRLNVIKRTAFFRKNGASVFPLVVHFCGKKGRVFYLLEKLRLFIRVELSFSWIFDIAERIFTSSRPARTN
ncbi:MAG: hypothetical protein LBG84_00395, partial [Treponema sp.]|nr:hypothetical protein [Treponema sp.]